MEEELIGGASFSEPVDLDSPQSDYTTYLDSICPLYLMYGMTWEEFWYESIERYHDYWQKHQFDIERRNQELWLQGLYIREAIASSFDPKGRCKYPDKPHRITEMTKAEKEAEQKRKVEQFRESLNEIKRRSDARRKGGGS